MTALTPSQSRLLERVPDEWEDVPRPFFLQPLARDVAELRSAGLVEIGFNHVAGATRFQWRRAPKKEGGDAL